MSDKGVTPQGFVRPSTQEIFDDRVQRIRDLFGPVNTSPESAFGQLIGAEADREDRIWQAMEAVYLNQYPDSAAGRSLDGAVQLTGIQRLGATRSTVTGVIIGVTDSVIPAGSQASVEESEALFETLDQITLDGDDAIQCRVEVTTVTANEDYLVTLGGTPFTYTASADPDEAEILEGLQALIDADDDYEASVDGDLFVIAADRVTSFSVTVGDRLELTEVGAPVVFRALIAGETLALEGTLNTIETPVAGWDEVINYVDGTPGRNVETDAQLRIRRLQSLQVTGTATVEAIRARLLNDVEDVTAATVIENRADVPDGDGRPPHSFEAVVSGGLDQDVGDLIWLVKPAGIETTGDITVTVLDSTDREQPISFSRPIDVYVWLEVTVNLNGVGTFPDDGESAVADNLVEYGDTLGVGDDIIQQALFGPIYQVPGIATVTVAIATTPSPAIEPDPGDFVQANVTISPNEISLWSADRIEVTVNE